MANIRKNASGSWEVRIRRKGVPQLSRSFPSKREASAFAASLEDKIARGKSTVTPDMFTVGEVLEAYASYLTDQAEPDALGVKKMDSRTAAYLNGLMPHFGEFSVGFLRKRHIEAFARLMQKKSIPAPANAKKRHPLYDGNRKKTYAQSTVRKFIYSLKLALDWHASNHDYTYDPHLFAFKKPPAWKNQRKRRLEEGEENRILDACRTVQTRNFQNEIVGTRDRKHGLLYVNLVKLLIETAARLGELVQADWSEFDLKDRVWYLPEEHCKTKKSRMVPLSEIAVGILEKMKKDEAARPFEKIPKGKAIFVTWKRICKDAEINDFGFHDFRHEAISRWVVRGGGDLQISKAAGHDLSVMKDYAVLRPKELGTFVNG
ncbi:MAG: site-specific integrase [Betaproteobacteria bacterium]